MLLRRPIRACAFAFCLLLAAGAAQAAPQPFTANYSAKYKGIPASAVMTLAPRGKQWALAMNVSNLAASISQATFFTEARGRYMPLGASDITSYLGQRRTVPARFDWRAMQATWAGDAKPSRRGPVAIRVGDLDGLLLQLALAEDVPAGRPLQYRVIENGRARPMSFRRAGTETVTVDGRRLQATRVVSSSDGKTTTMWIADGIPVPVRVVLSEGGSDAVSMQLTSWR
jgi:hypothetical protein